MPVKTRVRGKQVDDRLDQDMARDSPDPQPSLRRKKGGAAASKEGKRATTRKEKNVDDLKDDSVKNLTEDIQEELTQKLENLLERDRLGVRLRSLYIYLTKSMTFTCLFFYNSFAISTQQ